jgi:hypothetical protein
MDNKFYIDDFERYLKEKADEFKMYPSKRVWNSIYNDMHPGSRWPSISMCIVLIGTLFLVGFLNTNTTNKTGRNSLANQTSTSFITASYVAADLGKTVSGAKDIESEQKKLAASSKTVVAAVKNNISSVIVQPVEFNKNSPNTIQANKHYTNSIPVILSSVNYNNTAVEKLLPNNNEWNSVAPGNTVSTDITSANIDERSGDRLVSDDANNFLTSNNSTAVNGQSRIIEKNRHYETIAEKSLPDLHITINSANTTGAVRESAKTNNNNIAITEADKFWIENYAMYNRPAPKKWKGKLSLQTYFTPSVVYRSLENTAADKNIGLTGFADNSDINNSVTHTPSFGAELGTSLRYDLSKRIKIKGGIQLNFTRYNAHAFDNGHPIATSITMLGNNGNVAYEEYRISPYNSNYGITPVKLHNQTYQVSLPVGADYKIAGADNFEWYAGATIQPTFVLGGRSYLISTDRRNYVKESDMLNRFNLNAGLETYIAIKTKGFTWQIGPQFRKQIFSTNSKTYSIEERLMNYGVKIGITKKL